MRSTAISAVAAAAAVGALPGGALAGPRADYKQTFTTPVPGKSTGIDTRILYKHPDDPEAKPIPIRQEVFTFPKGIEFDDSVVPDCTVSDLILRIQGESACPPETWTVTGHGDTSMTGFPGAGETRLKVTGFEFGDGRFRVLGQPEEMPLRFVAHGRREGRTNTIEVPETPGGPPDGQGALRNIHNVVPPRSLGRRAAIRTPRRCPESGFWVFRARMTFADGVVERNVHRMPCRRKTRR